MILQGEKTLTGLGSKDRNTARITIGGFYKNELRVLIQEDYEDRKAQIFLTEGEANVLYEDLGRYLGRV
jgi:hypothetical protein